MAVETKTKTALITMEYTVETFVDDKGDAMHPPQAGIRIDIEDIDIDGETLEPMELERLLIAFLKERIR